MLARLTISAANAEHQRRECETSALRIKRRPPRQSRRPTKRLNARGDYLRPPKALVWNLQLRILPSKLGTHPNFDLAQSSSFLRVS